MTSRLLAPLPAVLLAACSSAPLPSAERPTAVAPEALEPARTVQEELETLLEAQARGISAGDEARFASVLAADAMVVGPMADAVLLDRAAVIATLRRVLPDAGEVRTATELHALETSGEGRSAWSFHEVTVTGQGVELAFRVSTVFERRPDGWMVVAQAWTLPLSDERAMRRAADRDWPALPELAADADEGTAELVSRAEAWRTNMIVPEAPADGALGVGSAPGEITRSTGQQLGAIRRAIDEGTLSVEPAGGGVRARTVGGLSWVFYQELYGVGPEQLRLEMPLRVFEVYEATPDGWVLTHAHVSLPVEL